MPMFADAHISSLGYLCLSLYVLLSQYRLCDNTLGSCFFQISFYSRANMSISNEKTTGQVPLRPLLEKQNIRAEEVYYNY